MGKPIARIYGWESARGKTGLTTGGKMARNSRGITMPENLPASAQDVYLSLFAQEGGRYRFRGMRKVKKSELGNYELT